MFCKRYLAPNPPDHPIVNREELEPIGAASRVYLEEDMSALEAAEQARASV